MRNLMFIVFALFLFASCEELSNDQEGTPTVTLIRHTDSTSVWIVENTAQPDTMPSFRDMSPAFELKRYVYVGYGYGYQPVYLATLKK